MEQLKVAKEIVYGIKQCISKDPASQPHLVHKAPDLMVV